MDEQKIKRGGGLEKLARDMTALVETLGGLQAPSLLPHAAE